MCLRTMDIPCLLSSLNSIYMDTISRENNSMLPMGGVIVGAVALIIGAYAAISLSKVNRTLAAQADKVARIDDISTQGAVTQIANELAAIHEQIKHMEEAHTARAAAKGPKGEPAVAGPGEYIVKAGDTGVKIARANGCSLADLESVNAGVSWTHLKVGEKLKLPEKK